MEVYSYPNNINMNHTLTVKNNKVNSRGTKNPPPYSEQTVQNNPFQIDIHRS